MIRTLTGYSDEIDDVELAVSEILEHLNIKENLLRNSIGIIACSLDFIKSGVVRALCGELPFDVVGINTFGSATALGGGYMILSVVVLTSDDASFSAGVSKSVEPNPRQSIEELYNGIAAGLDDEPKLMLAILPFLPRTSGDTLTKCLDSISGGVPIFGFVPSDYTTNFRLPLVIFNGETYQDSCAIVLLSGSVRPRFFSSAIPEDKVLKRKAIVTESDGNYLKSINGTLASEFIESHGIIERGNIWGSKVIPFIIDFNDGTPCIVRVLNMITREGYLILGGEAQENSTIGFGMFDSDDIIDTASCLIDAISETSHDCLLIASCVTRNFILELDNDAEIELFRSRLGNDSPFLFLYGGGEVYPAICGDKNCSNRFHNLTLVCCAL
ncbi:MAG: FIST C-terminal domain-containing protein [Synergistaceae bacterium]|jgi:hypothetical protein|nr:FIST C-terminal domain-containing protein [Synergistaceae bacterium]